MSFNFTKNHKTKIAMKTISILFCILFMGFSNLIYSQTNQCVSGNCQDGFGVLKYNDASFEGFFKDGKREGFGNYKWNSGAFYSGMWRNDVKHGYGYYKMATGVQLNGTFQFGLLTGLGTKKFTDNTSEQGHYQDGQLVKKYDFYKNNVEKGCVAGDCKEGYGKFVHEDGAIFIGFFKNGKRYEGTWVTTDGNNYIGQFDQNNQFDGSGTFIQVNKESYFGEFKSGKRHGRGFTYNFITKTSQKGEWKDGVLFKEY